MLDQFDLMSLEGTFYPGFSSHCDSINNSSIQMLNLFPAHEVSGYVGPTWEDVAPGIAVSTVGIKLTYETHQVKLLHIYQD